ncbi:MAG: signal peptidase I [Chloroflexota bacterium]
MQATTEATSPSGTYEVLAQYVAGRPDDERAWLLLSQVAPSPEEQQRCLERVLALNPSHTEAASRLASLAGAVRPAPARGVWARLAHGAGGLGLGLAALLLLAIGLASLPVLLGDRAFITLSGSMEPAISTGAVVVAQPVPTANIQVGDVIVFSANASSAVPIIHRVLAVREEKGARLFTTRGDANATDDVAEVGLPPTAWRAAYSIPLVGYAVAGATSPTGRVLLIGLPLLALLALPVLTLLQRRLRPARPAAAGWQQPVNGVAQSHARDAASTT